MTNLLLRSRYWVLAACLLLAAPALWSCNSQSVYQKQLAEHDSQMRAIDEDTIQNYLKRNNLLSTATRTNSGLYLVPITNGTGPQVTKGAQVQLKYVGRFLSNGAHPESSGYPASLGNPSYPQGTIFDNSADNKTQCGCVVFTGGSGAIAGFNEGLLLMRKGDRKLLLIPSRLAYGPGGASGIPADAALMFDVEILDIL
ncbi:FKBP-type peptidyl-prolyl cis-trans isomerase [Hymenobacter properus]|uniref:Peptidyl-prolyl cis-trans isomerase n=1 Tax=Hymenobacter properus TaxID=2791026 RepID=A0A931FME3_9BACT|nr:FKBP-type peptidyl-prolyl cis-trans isomerase [Hymenobacter properus]MBF9143865.1 FKBP-type peptidyl-prolyl cis-trans isomerase [Hymenobacter properus]MBR7722679.1 FKBP-type peptidyl-prolyl cis-trans isomerase [Microvirga sp. SRT04]